MTETTAFTVKEALQALNSGQVSSLELTRAYLERIQGLEPALHTFITLTPDAALAAAKAADEQRAQLKKTGAALPPLLGLPLAVKDVLCVKDVRTTCGSKILEHFKPPFNATAVQKLLDAGVVVLGKTNTDEFAMGSSTENSAYGVTHNPWDTERGAGRLQRRFGGGRGRALRAGCPGHRHRAAACASRASFCGVTGIKPTYGRVSRYGLIAYGSSLDSVGVLGRSAEDVEPIFRLMAGFDPRDSTSLDWPVDEPGCAGAADLTDLRVGVPKEYFIEGIQPEVEARVHEAIQVLAAQGAQIEEISLPHTSYALPVYYLIAPAEASANLARYDGVRFGLRAENSSVIDMFMKSRGKGFGPEVKRRIMLGTYALSAGYYDAYYGQAQKVRTLIKADFDEAFKSVDVVAAPIAPTTAFKIGGHGDDPLAMYLEDVFTLPANLAGVPGLAFPVGFDAQKLPVGMQLMGRPFEERTLFRAAHVYQQATDFHKQTPAI
jgi:aspartyl/glutamyl-tRNA(Asn/Gln) amidotransferase, A subunit